METNKDTFFVIGRKYDVANDVNKFVRGILLDINENELLLESLHEGGNGQQVIMPRCNIMWASETSETIE